jgi:hypothetical protein
MSRHHETTVVCADGPQWNPGRFQSDFDQYLASHGPVPGLNVVFVPQPRLGRALIRVNKRLSGMPDAVGIRILYVLALRAWQRRVAQMVNSQFMHKTDVVHHLTPIAYWACTPLWKFPKPSFWGPMSGLGRNAPQVRAMARLAHGCYGTGTQQLQCAAGPSVSAPAEGFKYRKCCLDSG